MQGGDISPESGTIAYAIGSDDQAVLGSVTFEASHPYGNSLIVEGNDTSPESGTIYAVFSSDDHSTGIGVVSANTFGNEISDQRPRGGII